MCVERFVCADVCADVGYALWSVCSSGVCAGECLPARSCSSSEMSRFASNMEIALLGATEGRSHGVGHGVFADAHTERNR